MPENTVYVGRPTKWGNHHVIKNLGKNIYGVLKAVELCNTGKVIMCADYLGTDVECRTEAVKRYRKDLPMIPPEIEQLRGKNLACFCPLDQPCHADILLQIANQNTESI